ncbi:MAG: hypothetical protein DRJ14_03300 [Acidobacteria bacterium]|nr:MAG: hypothetical protein DRJ14_03300 [Acidobacteriota bacterium]
MNERKPDLEEFEKLKKQPVILFHGFTGEQLNTLIDTLKHSPAFATNIIMATTTASSVNWRIKDLLNELSEERAALKGLNQKQQPD